MVRREGAISGRSAVAHGHGQGTDADTGTVWHVTCTGNWRNTGTTGTCTDGACSRSLARGREQEAIVNDSGKRTACVCVGVGVDIRVEKGPDGILIILPVAYADANSSATASISANSAVTLTLPTLFHGDR